MKNKALFSSMLAAMMIVTSLLLLVAPAPASAAVETKKLIYDEAGLLTSEEISRLTELAAKLGAERETDFIIITTNNPDNVDIRVRMENFYDDTAPGYDKAHGNAAILGIDMKERDVQLMGFYQAETYLDNERMDKIRNRITPALTAGNYVGAFEQFIKTGHRYMGFEPDVNPDNILFNIWFQLGVSAALGLIIVGAMLRNSGGRVTVGAHTYQDDQTSGLMEHWDRHVNTTVTKRKIERPSSGGGGGGFGGGGGRTGGGHSYSGSRGKF